MYLPGGCANHYPTRASRYEVSNVGTIEGGLQSTNVPNSGRKWHRIHILVLIHSPLYLAPGTLRRIVDVSSFPPMRVQIEVWAVSNLTFILLSFTKQNSTTEFQFKVLTLYSLRYVTLKRVKSVATSAVCRLRKDYLKHYMLFKTLCITRNACTQRNETKALGLPVVKRNTRRRNVWRGVIQDVRSHKDLLCNMILFVGYRVCVALYQWLYNATIAC